MELGECKDARIFGSISVATAAACLLHYLLPTYIHPQYKNAAAGRRLIVFTFIGRWRTTQIARRRRSRKRKNASRWCYGQLRIPLYSYVGYTTSRLTVRDKRWIKRLCMWNKPSFGWDLLNFLYIHIFIPGLPPKRVICWCFSYLLQRARFNFDVMSPARRRTKTSPPPVNNNELNTV